MELIDSKASIRILQQLTKEKTINTKSKISRDTNISYAHLVKLIQELNKKKLVTIKKEGRTSQVTITEKGKQIANKIQEAETIYNE